MYALRILRIEIMIDLNKGEEMTLSEATHKTIIEQIEDFHYYINELGLDKAKEIILGETCLEPVKKYVAGFDKCSHKHITEEFKEHLAQLLK